MDSRSQTMMREVIDRTLDFVKRATAAPYQAALRRGLPQATAASYVLAGNFRQAVSTSGDGRYATACAEFEKLKGKGLGYRDLGVPAARA